ncbi:YbfB/YjiJ family MFS transporter [Sneathiella marina]|uniref:YbfB/YjiJ family MFS transporter n=1 Tax=Sneathiella marina TaxID=2950108 RepID=A0ABY4W793_9PROT|nr:YbfB/YjiJ family MFS transporter [Sneathiella marina]USG62716.1 YbfB/YjiJ family MFS transporter [Sneathiella marina]
MIMPSKDLILVAVGGLIALAVGLALARFVYTPILPYMESGLGITKTQAGLIASANFLGYLLGAVLAAKENLPGSVRGWLLVSLFVCAVTTMAMGWTTSFNLLIFLRVVGGCATAFVMIFGSALVLTRLAAGGRSDLSAVHFAGVGTGIAVSAILISVLAKAGIGWQGMWIWSGGISLVLILPVMYLVPPLGRQRPLVEPVGKPVFSKSLKALVIAYFLLGFGYIITATFISVLVRQIPELQWMQSIVWLVVGIAAIPSVAWWTWLGSKIGNGRSYGIACLFLALGVAISVLGQGQLAFLVASALLGATFMGLTALGLVSARELMPNHVRKIMAIMTIAFGLGQMIGPTFAGFAYEIYGSFLVPSFVAVAGLIVASFLVVLVKERDVSPEE